VTTLVEAAKGNRYDHQHRGLYGPGAEQVQGFLAGVSAALSDLTAIVSGPAAFDANGHGAARVVSCPCGLGRCRALKVFRATARFELCGGDNADGS
jgi:hypothetical protein